MSSAGVAAAGDLENGARRPWRAIARQEDDGRGDILRRTCSAQGCHRQHHLGVLRTVVVFAALQHIIHDQARRYGVDADAMRPEFDGQHVRQHVHRGLTACVVRAADPCRGGGA